jgi:putative effector of murein hydrolase LrgA (UPF0299 family)
MALLYPGWVKLGESGASGIESLGQVMLTTGATMLMLFVLLLVPAGVAITTVLALGPHGGWPIALAGLAAGSVLAAESYLLMHLLGGCSSGLIRCRSGD